MTPNPELSSQYRFAMPSSPGNSLQLHRHTNLLSGSACIPVSCLRSCSQHPPSITLQKRFVSHSQLQSEATEPTNVYLFHLQPGKQRSPEFLTNTYFMNVWWADDAGLQQSPDSLRRNLQVKGICASPPVLRPGNLHVFLNMIPND